MKGIFYRGLILTALIAAVLTSPLAAQEDGFSPAEGDYYTVYYQGAPPRAAELARSLDAYAELFEEYLHFDRSALPAKLKVKIFASREAYTGYLEETIGTPRDSFVFLQYSDPAQSELAGYETGSGFESSLVHHAFIQYLKSFIPYPPLWLQKGMAIYLEKSTYSPEEQRAVYRENLDWLKSLKTYVSMDSELIPISILLTMDVESANRQIESFYAQSWGLVYFLLNSPAKEYNRIIWDALSALEKSASRPENESAVIDKGFAWVNKDTFLTSFEKYIAGLRTFPELVQEGIAAYGRGENETAAELFRRALELRKDHYIPYYYLGLIEYAGRDYTMSDYLYSQALERGAAKGLIYYAKGITAYSAEDTKNAVDYLREVLVEDPEGYGSKARELLDRILAEENGVAPASEPASIQEEPEAEPEPDEALPDETDDETDTSDGELPSEGA
jgi:tetratricopeptide (TPR) repeat protein